MKNLGIWSAPLLCSDTPKDKNVIPENLALKIKFKDKDKKYELYTWNRLNGSRKKESTE